MARQTEKLTVLPPLEALLRGRAVLEDRTCWTKSAPARRPEVHKLPKGRVVWSYEPTIAMDTRATKWSACGILNKIYGARSGAPGFAELEAAALGMTGGTTGIGRLNDDPKTTHAMILAVYDRAITGAKTALTT